MDYPWYSIIKSSKDLQQGDFVYNCPIVVPPNNVKEINVEVEVALIDSIVLSQSCDLVNSKIDIVLVCPFYTLKTFIDNLPPDQISNKKAKNKIIDNLRKGNLPGYHLLNKENSIENLSDYQVVDFKNVYGISFKSLTSIVEEEERIRLLPPYREHLSQAFARYFMRVGLPQDINIEGY